MSQENLVGIMGWPVSHSLSPKMHNFAFKKLSLNDWRYVFLPVKPENIKDAIFGLRALGFRGANVTVPHKEAVLPFLNLSQDAEEIGAVNTIHIIDDKMFGHNTDAFGLVNDFLDHGIDPKGLDVSILGAGGSAKAIAYGLLSKGAKLTIFNRTLSKAEAIEKSLSQRFSSVKAKVLEPGVNSFKADLIINATSLGLINSDQSPCPNATFNKNQVVYDIIYGKKTALLEQAANDGAKTMDGLGMLIHQGALAFKIWTGVDAPVELMKEALEKK